MSVKKSVSKCTQVDTELVSVSLSAFDLPQEGLRVPPRPASARPPRPARRLRRTFSDGYARNTSEEYLLDSCTFDSSFGHDDPGDCSYRQPYSEERLIPDQYPYPPRQAEYVCSCPHPNYYYTSNTLPRDRRSDPFYSSEQNISGRLVTDRSSEELIISQRSLDRKIKTKSHVSSIDRKARQSRAWERQSRTNSNKFELNFLPVKERSLDGADYPIRHYRNDSRCGHSSLSESRSHQCVNRLNFSNNFEYDSQHVFINKCDGSFYENGEGGKGCVRSLPPHFGDDERRFENSNEAKQESRPRKSYGLGGRRVIVPDGCEQDESFEMLYNVSGCQCERCDHAGFPGGYCHSQESIRADRQSARSLTGSGLGTPLGAPPRALAFRPPSLTSSSTELAQRHWYAIATVLLVAGAAGVAVPLALRVSAGASLDERLELAAALLASSPLIDGHNDLPWNIRKFLHNKLKDFRFSEDLRNIPPWSTSPWSHTDLPRLKQGLVSAQCEYVKTEADSGEEHNQSEMNDMTEIEEYDVKDVYTSNMISTDVSSVIMTEQKRKRKKRVVVHQCKTCGKVFKAKGFLSRHMQVYKNTCNIEKPKVGGSFKCDKCGKASKSKSDLSKHMRIHVHSYDFDCDKCEKVFKTKSLLMQHMNVHMDSRAFQCDTCGKAFKSKGEIVKHMNSHTDSYDFECRVCKKLFKAKRYLLRHMKVHVTPCIFECNLCGKGFKIEHELSMHMEMHADSRDFKCEECDKSFISKNDIIKHMLMHIQIYKYTCRECGKIMKSKTRYIRHMKIHDDSREFECNVCKKAFRTNYNLTQHTKILHSDIRAFKCGICGQAFKVKNYLDSYIYV